MRFWRLRLAVSVALVVFALTVGSILVIGVLSNDVSARKSLPDLNGATTFESRRYASNGSVVDEIVVDNSSGGSDSNGTVDVLEEGRGGSVGNVSTGDNVTVGINEVNATNVTETKKASKAPQVNKTQVKAKKSSSRVIIRRRRMVRHRMRRSRAS